MLIGIGLILIGPTPQPSNPTGMMPDDADSTRVSQIVAEQGEPGDNQAVVFFSSSSGTLDVARLQEIAQELGGPLIPNEDATAALVPTTIESSTLTGNSEAVTQLRERLNAEAPQGVSVKVTGPAAISADLSAVFEGANVTLLAVTGLIVAVLLIFTYRSPVLWIIPLAVIGVADRVAATAFTWVLGALGMTWNESTAGIVSVLVFGAGTNYALLLISRYRDELTQQADRFAAMATALRPTATTVVASGGTVIVGVACLLLSATPANRGLGGAAMVGILIAMFFVLAALPGALVACGRWVFWPRRPEPGTQVTHGVWAKVADYVAARPVKVASVTLIGLLAAAAGYPFASVGLKQEDQFISTPESVTAAAELREAFPENNATPARVLTTEPERVTQELTAAGITATPPEQLGEWTSIQATASPEGTELVPAIRDAVAGTDTLVGGQDAQLIDAARFAAQDRTLIFPLVLLVILAALMVLLRSVLGPVIMVASVLLTNLAALGLGWWVSTGIFGFERFAETTPLYSFVFLVALGIDYSIFLITRTREEAATAGTRDGVRTAVAATGGVITSAGILLAAVFAALGVLPLVALAQIGVVIFVGVLLDTLVVRPLLIPALVMVLGEKFWWPGGVEKRETT
ncbi:MMPL family transporter [Corynebacterium tapiri]|uniref:MMPL family transporter n=2 Tax=Corynebacterium tapiri TaxID=1448266 RepID=A0A5C4U6E0_9CORY|nr:MMPL family transporter [Corynebacterium tapiri]